jgi:HSP20 family molecular chaperone IbpA
MFDEMDEVFARLFSRLEETAFSDNPPSFGYHILISDDNSPLSERDGCAVQPSTLTLPEPEVHRIDNEIKVIAELPGVVPETLRLDLHDQDLVISADGPAGTYLTFASLPPVETGSMQKTFRNGVLEVTFQILPGTGASV